MWARASTVSNLPYDTEGDDLVELFEDLQDGDERPGHHRPVGGRSRGFEFVEMANDDEVPSQPSTP